MGEAVDLALGGQSGGCASRSALPTRSWKELEHLGWIYNLYIPQAVNFARRIGGGKRKDAGAERRGCTGAERREQCERISIGDVASERSM